MTFLFHSVWLQPAELLPLELSQWLPNLLLFEFSHQPKGKYNFNLFFVYLMELRNENFLILLSARGSWIEKVPKRTTRLDSTRLAQIRRNEHARASQRPKHSIIIKMVHALLAQHFSLDASWHETICPQVFRFELDKASRQAGRPPVNLLVWSWWLRPLDKYIRY